jgi:hypothetical protein
VEFYPIKPYQAAIQERFMARCTKDRGLVGTEDRSSGGCPISLKDEFLINFCAYKCKTTPFLVGILNFYAGKFEKSYLLDNPQRNGLPFRPARGLLCNAP